MRIAVAALLALIIALALVAPLRAFDLPERQIRTLR
jgi:hypothetical protein